MDGAGPFLWLSTSGPRRGFRTLPPSGMCVSAFLFVEQEGKLLLGKYADDPRWEDLTGHDASTEASWSSLASLAAASTRAAGARTAKAGRSPRASSSSARAATAVAARADPSGSVRKPRAAGQRIAREVLGLDGLALSEPRIESDLYVPKRFPELGEHYDLWLFFTASVPRGVHVAKPAWYRELNFLDPAALRDGDYARGHEDVVSRWLAARAM